MTDNSKIRSVVFLDVDGVLNTKSSCVKAPSEKYVGIDEARIEVLAYAMKQNCVDGVVLTSTWKDMREDEEDYVYLVDSLHKCGIRVLGKTKEERFTRREEGILQYLELHPEVEDFVIIDDQHFGFEKHSKLWESFLDTKGKGIENCVVASKTPSIQAILFLDSIKEYE